MKDQTENTAESLPQSDGLDLYDLCIVGGGINGAGIARDAAGQGLSVALLEQGDLAQETSSKSTKLIHGGLRYLEYFEFGLVRKALIERSYLLKIAPHIISPMSFVMPHDPSIRPAWLLRMGLWLYDILGLGAGKGAPKLARSRQLALDTHEWGESLNDKWSKGFVYSDCGVDDARLVVLNAMSAKEKGAKIITQDGCDYISAERANKLWRVRLKSGKQLKCRMLVNASGPWVRHFLGENGMVNRRNTPSVRLVQGSHIVVPKLYEGQHAYIIQKDDGRIVFAIPYYGYTAIGTTEVNLNGDPDEAVKIKQEEIEYLCELASESFKTRVKPEDVVNSWSGVRPLLEDGAKDAKSATRDYKLFRNDLEGCPVLSIFGGKITTYRHLAEDAMRVIGDTLGSEITSWTKDEVLPGGDVPKMDMFKFQQEQWKKYPWLPQGLLLRYALSYGTKMDVFLEGATGLDALGQDFGYGLYEAEVRYLMAHEWAKSSEDILWRRSKLGLVFDDASAAKLEGFMSCN